MHWRFGIILVLFCCATSWSEISLVANDSLVEISNDIQKLSFIKSDDGRFHLFTYVLHGATWEPLFDARRPLIEGANFNLEPTTYVVLEDSSARKLVQFRGISTSPPNVWDIGVEARADSPLFWFQIACHFQSAVTLLNPQPTVALWMNQSSPEVVLNQGPPSPTGDVYQVPFNFGFPAAYLWNQSKEAAVFFDMSPMVWMSPQGVFRFLDVQIRAISEEGQTGLGLYPRRLHGNQIRAGEMLTVFYLYSRWRPEKPDKFDALETLIKTFAPLHPAHSTFPSNTLEGGEVSWEHFTQKAIRDFQVLNVTYGDLFTIWNDSPLALASAKSRMIVHPSRAASSEQEAREAWTFATTNHHLAPWMLYALLHGDADALEFARLKKDALPRFYDPQSRMLSSGTRLPNHVFPLEISWQSLVYYQEMIQIYRALAVEDFNPAIAGRFLMGLDGLMDYARKVDYVFSTYFDPFTKSPHTFVENPGLGDLREPWSVGSYSYVMMLAYELTGNLQYLEEAENAISVLLTSMSYTESNNYYTATYSDPMEMPVMELMGNAYGAVAAYLIYQQTQNEDFLNYSRDFMNTLIRMTFWYDDESDAVSRDLRSAGLFYPFVGANCATPWETSEAHFCIAWMLKHDLQSPIYPLLLKLANLNRINSFSFYPATYTDTVRALNPGLRRDLGQYFPIEELYTLECMGGSTGRPGTAMYMAGNAMWNYWMYEALAESSDREIMVLNPDVLEDLRKAVSSAQRHLIIYNPTENARTFTVRMKFLKDGDYQLQTAEISIVSSSQLTEGLSFSLNAHGSMGITLSLVDAGQHAELEDIQIAQDRVSYAYQLLQEWTRDQGVSSFANNLKDHFQSAMNGYGASNYGSTISEANWIIQQILWAKDPNSIWQGY